MRRVTVIFTHGISINGMSLKKAELRELNGHDQEQLIEQATNSAFARGKSLLANLVYFGDKIGGFTNEFLLTSLSIGDFVALILELRKITFGETFQCLIVCPFCKENMSCDIPVAQLEQKSRVDPREVYKMKTADFTLKLRPVTIADLLIAIEESETNPIERLTKLCITNSEPELPERLDAELLGEINSKLSELDPQADLLLDLTCPNCEKQFLAPFFPEDFFLREIDARKSQLDREVHWLAFNYHWSEDEILSLPLSKRRKYVEMINGTLSGENV